ncbi:hypothetical protein BAUCODRAFT_434806 [Baudoinia panamericana UAMH 10762]|uniref:Apple domain-containing protein n=1 Tax=Baudoinia panamericana (strain UAMH 10762) TaxID=717646 RepID=M2LRB5_BAUPA|nr:uncharacterized protein BAUCODRAFT_434806 [Baudoinia panamericana UAMH 10762]EMC96977.1 hypothetical protein BAUCODRAFT_434806 [Baudoinia panamericana UAMH 10762]
MAFLIFLFVIASLGGNFAQSLTAVSSINYQPTITGGPGTVVATRYSYAYTVTTPTTMWTPPAFTQTIPVPHCSNTLCNITDHQHCIDNDSVRYGILCNIRFSGTEITNSGRRLVRERERRQDVDESNLMEDSSLEEREYTGSFNACSDFCNDYGTACQGLMFRNGYCTVFDSITGTFSEGGSVAALRQV